MSGNGDPAPTTLDVNARYDKLGEAFGAKTYYVTTPDELKSALTEAIASKKPALIDVQLAADIMAHVAQSTRCRGSVMSTASRVSSSVFAPSFTRMTYNWT